METHEIDKKTEATEKLPKYILWIKKNLLFSIVFIIIFVLLVIFVVKKINKLEAIIFESIVIPTANMDFQNQSGAYRIKSTFSDVLIASEGSIKKGDGYELKLRIINPSSVTLHNVKCQFRYSGNSMPVNCEDINMFIAPGSSRIMKCFVSDLSDYDLKSIDVSVHFDQMRFY